MGKRGSSDISQVSEIDDIHDLWISQKIIKVKTLIDSVSQLLHVFETHPRRLDAGGRNIALLRRYRCFFGPPYHEDYHNHGRY